MRVDGHERTHRADRPRADPGDQVHPAAVEHDQREQSRGQSDQGAAAEGEVERRRERDQRGGGEHPHQHVAPRGEPERQDDADDGERPERVPVADRLVEAAVPATGRVHAEGAGVEPRRHAVTRDGDGRGDNAPGDRDAAPPVGKEEQRGGARDVHEDEAAVVDGRRPVARPHPRDGRPQAQPGQAGGDRERGPRHPQVARRGQDHNHDGGVERRREAPRTLEVAAVVSGEKADGDGGEHERRGRRPHLRSAAHQDALAGPAPGGPLTLVLIDRLRARQVRSSSCHTPSAR